MASETTHRTMGDMGQHSRSDEAEKHSEGSVARMLEERTAQVPSDVWLWSAVASMGASLVLQMMDKRESSLFVGQWAAPFLLIGVYNKLIKVAGSDRSEGGSPYWRT